MHRHHAPRDQAVVHGSKAAAEQSAEQAEELHRRIGIHGEHFFEQGSADGEDRAPAGVCASIGGSGLLVNEGHLTEDLAPREDREALFAGAGDHARDAHRTIDDDVETVSLFALGDDE